MKCTLIVGKKSKWALLSNSEEETFTGHYTNTNLFFESIKDAKKVAVLAGVDCFRVMKVDDRNDYSYSDEPLYETADITRFNERQREKSYNHEKEQNRKVREINKLPKKIEVLGPKVSGCKVFLMRHEYSYDKRISRNLSGYVSVWIFKDNKVVSDMFSPSNYIKRNGSVMVKKFKEDFYWRFGVHTEDLPSTFDYKGLLLEIRSAKQKFENKIRNV